MDDVAHISDEQLDAAHQITDAMDILKNLIVLYRPSLVAHKQFGNYQRARNLLDKMTEMQTGLNLVIQHYNLNHRQTGLAAKATFDDLFQD
jgi:hypothetical protein